MMANLKKANSTNQKTQGLAMITRSFLLKNEQCRSYLIKFITQLPLNVDYPIEIVARDQVIKRNKDQNALMWSGALTDIAEQAFLNGRQYSIKIWHQHFKEEFLPEDHIPDLCKHVTKPEQYKKWDYKPDGERVCVGSTTDLTKHGFSVYLEQIYAYGAELGVQYGVKE